MVDVWINAAIESLGIAGTPLLAEFLEGVSAGKRKVEIKSRDLISTKVLDVSVLQVAECDGSVEIVEDVKWPRDGQDFVCNTGAFGAIARVDDNVGVTRVVKCLRADRTPFVIQDEPAEVGIGQIAPLGIVRNVLFVEDHVVTHAL
jgi:hypothetical protein